MASRNYHRFEARCYEEASSFQTVWHPLTQETNINDFTKILSAAMHLVNESCKWQKDPTRIRIRTAQMRNITTRHLYFLSRILQDSLLTRRLNQGISALIGLSGRCEKVVELFCLAGLEILKSIPHNHMLVLKFYKNMFLACADHQTEILLNFALYLVLRQHNVVEALELLKSKSNIEKFSQSLMHKAYIGLFEYLLHQSKQPEPSRLQGLDTYDSEDDNDIIFSQSFPTKSNVDFSLKRSVVLFEEVFSKPGVWDQFVAVYVELLQKTGEENTVRKFLEEYRDRNPLNLNSHRYLYHYLKTNSATDEEMLKVLEDLIKLDPTSEYVEDLVKLKEKCGDNSSVIRMLFEKLDHSACMYDVKAWTLLDSFVKIEQDLKHELQLCWKERKSWWPKYHFRLKRHFKFSNELKTVMLCKARVAEYFVGGNDFSKDVYSKYDVCKIDERNETEVVRKELSNEKAMIKELPDERSPLKRTRKASTSDTESERTKKRKR